MNKRPLVPSFLQKLDDKLLRNKPNTWSARTHLVIWFAFLFGLALSVFCYLAFFDAKQYSSTGSWATFVGMMAFIGLVFWLIFLLRFNVFKRYGNWFAWDGLKNFILYFISIGALVAVCFIPAAIETWRANQQFGNDEIVNDINELNVDACKLEYSLLPLQWTADTCEIVEKNHFAAPADVDVVSDTVIADIANRNTTTYHYIDTAELRSRMRQTDSLVKLTGSLYIFYGCPEYTFVNSYGADEYSTKTVLSSADVYRTVLKDFKKPDRAALLKRMDALKTKWSAGSRYGYSYMDGDMGYNNDDRYETKISKKYSLGMISNGIDNAVTKKYAWVRDWPGYLRIFYYTTLVLTLLVFIFRHTTVKTFFLSLLTAVILAIFTALLLVMSNGNETSILSFLVVYFIVFAILALSIFSIKTRKAVQGIGLNLFLFMTPFMPLVFVALNQAMKEQRYYAPGYYYKPEADHFTLYLHIAEVAGSVMFLILLEPLFKKLYRRWFAAPEN